MLTCGLGLKQIDINGCVFQIYREQTKYASGKRLEDHYCK